MDDIGDDTPYQETVILVDTNGRVGFVPWDEPTESSRRVYLELLDGKLAINKGNDEVAIRGFYLSVYNGKVSVEDASVMLSPDMRT